MGLTTGRASCGLSSDEGLAIRSRSRLSGFLRPFLKLLHHLLQRLCHLARLLSGRLSLRFCRLGSLFQGSILGGYLRSGGLRLLSLQSHARIFSLS